jgi:hypothetical protein
VNRVADIVKSPHSEGSSEDLGFSLTNEVLGMIGCENTGEHPQVLSDSLGDKFMRTCRQDHGTTRGHLPSNQIKDRLCIRENGNVWLKFLDQHRPQVSLTTHRPKRNH